MFSPPSDLPGSLVAEAVQSAWSLSIDDIRYAPVGFGSHHWVVTAESDRWFATVDAVADASDDPRGPLDRFERLDAALSTARSLNDLGLSFVVAPLRASHGELLVAIDDLYAVALYRYVDGEPHAWGPFPNRASLMAVADHLAALHRVPVDACESARFDAFDIPSRPRLEAALADTSTPWRGGPFSEPTRRLLERRARVIGDELARYDQLAAGVAKRAERLVVTHGEPHRANTITTAQGVMLVDWDTALIAPPERDLWWLTREDAGVGAAYERRTGTSVDPAALEFYRLRWDLTDLALFTAQLRDPHVDQRETQTAWETIAGYLDGDMR